MGRTPRSVTSGDAALKGPEERSEALAAAITRSRDSMSTTLEELHGVLNPRVLKEEILQQVQEGKAALKADLQQEFHEAKAALKTEFQDIKEQVLTGVKTEITDAKTAFREATIGKVETMVHNTQESVQKASHSLISSIKANPIPAALVGVGLVWMFRSSHSERQSRSTASQGQAGNALSRHVSQIGDKAAEVAQKATSAVSDAAHAAGQTLENTASSVKDSVSAAAQATTREFSHLREAVSSTGQSFGRRAEGAFAENPLAVGAGVLVAGALVGLAIPITAKETAWMGDANQQLTERASDLVEKLGSRVHDGVEQVASELNKSLAEQPSDEPKTGRS